MAMRSVPPAKADAAVNPSRQSAATAVQPRTSLIEIIRNLQASARSAPAGQQPKPWRSKRWAIPALAVLTPLKAALGACASPKFRHQAPPLGKAHIEIGGRSPRPI